MSKLQEYLANKLLQERIQTLGLPKLYIVKSNRLGVEKPVEVQVVNIQRDAGFNITDELPIDLYEINTSPYQVWFNRTETTSEDELCGTGFGDLWSHTNFASFSLSEAEMYYQKECIRIETTYLKDKQNE